MVAAALSSLSPDLQNREKVSCPSWCCAGERSALEQGWGRHADRELRRGEGALSKSCSGVARSGFWKSSAPSKHAA